MKRAGPMIVLLFGMLLCAIMVLYSCSGWKVSQYSTLEEAEIDGAIERGWLPSILPRSSRNIFKKHNLDTNQVVFRLEFDAEEAISVIVKLETPTDEQLERFRKWYPEFEPTGRSVYFYEGDGTQTCFLIDVNKGELQGWSLHP